MTGTSTTADELERTLADLEALQLRETEVLRSMDRSALDEITDQKVLLGDRLREVVTRTPLSERHRPALERVRRLATMNQLLLVHARDTVRNILSEATGAVFEPHPHNRRVTGQEGLRLNVRG